MHRAHPVYYVANSFSYENTSKLTEICCPTEIYVLFPTHITKPYAVESQIYNSYRNLYLKTNLASLAVVAQLEFTVFDFKLYKQKKAKKKAKSKVERSASFFPKSSLFLI